MKAAEINAKQSHRRNCTQFSNLGLVWRRGRLPRTHLLIFFSFVLCRIITFTGKILYNFLVFFFSILIIKAKDCRILPVLTRVTETLAWRARPAVAASGHSRVSPHPRRPRPGSRARPLHGGAGGPRSRFRERPSRSWHCHPTPAGGTGVPAAAAPCRPPQAPAPPR